MAIAKGLTFKIGADTSEFIKSLKSADKEINTLQKSANSLEKGLKLDFDSTRFEEAQKRIQNALSVTEEKSKAIKQQMKLLEDSGQIDSSNYEKLTNELAKTENQAILLNKQLKEINELKFDNATKGITTVGNSLKTASDKTKVLSVAAAAALVGMTALAKSAVSTGDEIQTLADKYNLSAEEIQKWNYIALQTDVEANQLYKAMQKVTDALGTGLSGATNNATQAISKLGLDINNIGTGDEAFEKIIEALGKVEDSTLQAYYANEIFGEKIVTDLLPLIRSGVNTLDELGSEFQQVGYLTNEQIKTLSEFDNEMNKVNTQLNVAKAELGLALLPVLDVVNDLLINYLVPAIQAVAEWFGNLDPSMQKIIIGGLALVAVLSPMLLLLSKITLAIPTLIKAFVSLKDAVNANKLGFAALAGAIGLTFDLIGNWGEMTTMEKVLKTLAVAALAAAAAMTVFHASWSLGIAVGAITAAIVAGIAAIKAAGQQFDIDTSGIADNGSTINSGRYDYSVPSSSSGNSGTTNYNEDNSTYDITVNLNASGELEYDSKTLAEQIIKEIITQKQALGR